VQRIDCPAWAGVQRIIWSAQRVLWMANVSGVRA
jgi:hypothetical protein